MFIDINKQKVACHWQTINIVFCEQEAWKSQIFACYNTELDPVSIHISLQVQTIHLHEIAFNEVTMKLSSLL